MSSLSRKLSQFWTIWPQPTENKALNFDIKVFVKAFLVWAEVSEASASNQRRICAMENQIEGQGPSSGLEAIWFLYAGGVQLGPFTLEQVNQLVVRKAVSHESFVFRVGWKDWRPLEECHAELGFDKSLVPVRSEQQLEERRATAPRASIAGRVVIHNNGNLTIGAGVNVSSSGIFVETHEPIFSLGEKLKLSIKVDGLEKPFNAVASVIRYNTDPRFPIGYGLRFEVLSDRAKLDIERLVAAANANHSAKRQAQGS